MLDEKLVPSRFIAPVKRPAIRIRGQVDRARLRVPYVILQVLRLGGRILWLRLRGKLDGPTLGRLLREFCQRMGVLWIKCGQLISMRADLASPEVRDELSKLQDRVEGFPPEVAVRQIEAELGAPLDRYLCDFESQPLAAASVAQVHMARLKREGTLVAVKVRRPNIQAICDEDLWLVRWFMRLVEWLQFRPDARWREMLWELEEAIREELDFRFEAANMRRMRRTLRPHGIYVPRIFDRYSTPGMLVMEFVRGVLMSDYLQAAQTDPEQVQAWREANGVRPSRIARTMFHSFLRQVFEDNVFHSDLHPGNIVLLRDNRIAFLDFGSLGSMERDFMQKVDLYMEAMGARQYAKMVDIYFLFSDSLPAVDLSECKNEMVRRLQAWDARTRVKGLPFRDKSFNAVQEELVWFAARYGVSPVWAFFRMTRAMMTMDASLRELVPDANVRALVAAYYRQRTRRILERAAKKPLGEVLNVRQWMDLQTRTVESFMFRGDIVRRDAAVFEGTTSQFAQFFSRLFGNFGRLVLAVALLLLAVLLYQRQVLGGVVPPGSSWEKALAAVPRLDTQVWVLLFALLWLSYRRLRRLGKRFTQYDAGPPDIG